MTNIRDIISLLPDVQKVENFSFAKHTTLGIGGIAPFALFPKNQNELIDSVNFLQFNKIPYIVIGLGANTLASDNVYNGVVVCTSFMRGVVRMSENRLFAECGVSAERLLRYSVETSLDGLFFIAGIPATVGGLVYMNAGAADTYIDTVIESVKVLRTGEVIDIPVYECNFSYKKSLFQTNDDCILGCVFKLRAGNRTEINAKIRARRFARSKLPNGKSLGCVFKNPTGFSAGELIDKAGWKGYSLGGIQVSDVHANFLINIGGATAAEFLKLVDLIQSDVLKKTGILLEREFCYIGD